MAREQERLTLLFAHLQNSPWRGSIPALLSLNQGWCPLHSHAQTQGGWAESRTTLETEARGTHQTKCFRFRENGAGTGRGMDVDTSPVLTSEEMQRE